jgi:hypothetical protein
MLSNELLEAEAGTVLPSRETMARFVFLNAIVYAPSASVVVINHSNYSSAVAISGASISIVQVAG